MVTRPPTSADSIGPGDAEAPAEAVAHHGIDRLSPGGARCPQRPGLAQRANCRRLPMKPGSSLSITTGSLPASRSTSTVRARTRAVCWPRTPRPAGSAEADTRSGSRSRARAPYRAISALAGWPLDEASTVAGGQCVSSRSKCALQGEILGHRLDHEAASPASSSRTESGCDASMRRGWSISSDGGEVGEAVADLVAAGDAAGSRPI